VATEGLSKYVYIFKKKKTLYVRYIYSAELPSLDLPGTQIYICYVFTSTAVFETCMTRYDKIIPELVQGNLKINVYHTE
jgi:hypothetical protein